MDTTSHATIYFTSYKLGQELTMIRKNRSELPPQLLPTKNRPVNSSKFVYTVDTSLVSYVPKKRKNVILMSTLHWDGRISGLEHQKPEIIMDYNATKRRAGQHRQAGVCLQL